MTLKTIKVFFLFLLLGSTHYNIAQNSLSGFVYDKETKSPLVGANIYFPALKKGTVSTETGFYTLDNIADGQHTLSVTIVGYASGFHSFRTDGKPKELDFYLEETFLKSQEIVISSGAYSSQHDNAIKVETIDLSTNETTASTNLMHSLTKIPGLDVISKGNGIIVPVIRGLSATNVLVLNNGIRMENYQFSENHPTVINESGLSKIEIIKGPASLLYGSDAVGGVINFLPEHPASIGKTQADIKSSYSSNANGLTTNIGFKSSRKFFSWGVRADIKTFRDYQDGNGNYVPNSRYKTKSFQAFSGFTKTRSNLQLYYTFMQMKLGLPIPDAFGANLSPYSYEFDVWFQHLKNHLFISKYKYFTNNWVFNLDFSYQNNRRRLYPNSSKLGVDMQLQTFSLQLNALLNFEKSGFLKIGYNTYFQNNLNYDALTKILPDYHLNEHSLFGIYHYNFQEKLNVQLGMRYDLRNYHVPEQDHFAHDHKKNSLEELISFDNTYNNFSFSSGFTYHLVEKWLVRANLASAYRTPHISELLQYGLHAGRFEVGNQNLKSQRNYEIDLSAHRHTHCFKFETAIYYNSIRDYIFLSPTMDITDDGLQIFTYTQNDSKIYGLEMGIEFFPSKNISFTTSYNYTKGVQDTKEALPFIPQNKIHYSAQLNSKDYWIFKKPSFLFGLVYAFDHNNPSFGQTFTDDYTLLNLSGNFEVQLSKQKLFVQLAITNLLNKTYIDHLSTLKGSPYYNPGRNIQIQLKLPIGILNAN
jgi:iron complex outermembrane receptor protein